MANWWDADPIAPAAGQTQSGNWWDADPVATPDLLTAAKTKLAEGLKAGKNGDQDTYRTAAFRTNQGVPAAGPTEAAIQGATLGFGDEASAAMRAPIDMATRGEGFNEAYQHNLAAERDRLDQYRKASPIGSRVAEAAGGLLTPVGQGGAVRTGATIGAIAGAGNSEGDLGDRAGGGLVGAAGGAVLGGVLSGAARAFGGKTPGTAPTIDELKAAASAGYKSPEVEGLSVKSPAISNFSKTTEVALNEAGIDANLAPKTFGILANLQKVPEESFVTGKNINSIRRIFANAASSPDPTERMAAKTVMESLDDFLPNINKADVIAGDVDAAAGTLGTARANYSAAKHAETIDNKTIQAELRAAASNSGQNVANTVRQRMADILIKPKEQRGFTPTELGMMERIVRGSRTENTMRAAGNVLGGGGGLGSVAAGFAGSVAAGPAGALAPVAGFALKSLSNKMTLRQAEKLSEEIRSRAPLASAYQKFEEKAAEFTAARNAKTTAAVALAARNFATNLKSSGLNISTGDLMGGLQLGGAGRANDEQ